MKNFDFLTKTLVNSFSYTTTTKNREAFADLKINGRMYTKYGTLQAVTIVGNVYKDCYGNKIMTVGVSKQHPCDSKVDKQIAYEAAQERAMFNPDMIINSVPDRITRFNFGHMMEWYVDAMKLEFVKTSQEIELAEKDPQKYNR